MERLKSTANYNYSIPYKNLFLLTLFMSVITININRINIAVGDIFLIYLNLLILLSLKHDIKLDSNRKKWLKKILIVFSIILFLSYISLHNYILTGYSIQRGIIELIKLTAAINYGFVFCFYFVYLSKKGNQDFLKFLILSALLVALTGLLGYFLYGFGIETPFVMHGQRAVGTLSDTNIMAIFMLTIIPLIFIRYRKLPAFIIFIILFLSVLATSSKAAVLVSLFLIIVFLTMQFLTGKLVRFYKFLYIVCILLFIFYSLINNSTMFSLLSSRLGELSSGDISVMTTGRSDLWITALSVLKEPRYLFLGVGYGAYDNLISMIEPNGYKHLVHHTYLSMFVETGLINFLIMSTLSLYLLLKTFFIALKSRDNIWIFVLLSQLSLIIGMNQVNLQNNRFVYILFAYYFFLISKDNKVLFESD